MTENRVEGYLDWDSNTGEKIAAVLNGNLKEFFAHRLGRSPTSDQLHGLRISARRLRYSLEFFRSPFGHALDETIEQIKQLQDTLGTVHDLDILEQSILAAVDGEAPTVVRLRREMTRRRVGLLKQFRDQWARLTHPECRQWLQDLLGQVTIPSYTR